MIANYDDEPKVKLWKLDDGTVRMARYVTTHNGGLQVQRAYIVRFDGFDNWVYWAPVDTVHQIIPALSLEVAHESPNPESPGNAPFVSNPPPPLTAQQAREMEGLE